MLEGAAVVSSVVEGSTKLEGAVVDSSIMLVRLAVLLERSYEDDSKIVKGSVDVEAARLLVGSSVVPEFVVYG